MAWMRHSIAQPDQRAVMLGQAGRRNELLYRQVAEPRKDVGLEDRNVGLGAPPLLHRSLVSGVLLAA